MIPTFMTENESGGSRVKDRIRYDCCVDAAMSVIEGRWKCTILCMLHGGPLRYSELQRRIEGITSRILSKQLRELEDDGMVLRIVNADRKLKVTYSLTKKGESILPILASLAEWGAMNQMINVIVPEEASTFDDLNHNASDTGSIELA